MCHATKGYFCIVQYCPDLARREVANVGVLLVVPDQGFLEVRIDPSNRRIERFFGPHKTPPEHINLMKQAFIERIEVEKNGLLRRENLACFVQTRANHIILTTPKAIRVVCPEAELESLFAKLVEENKLEQDTVITA